MIPSNPPPVPVPPQAVAKKTPGLALASLILGIVSILGAAVLVIPTILAIVFGHISLSRIRKDPNLTGSGMAIAGLVLGYVSIVFGIIFAGLMAAMAIPAFQKVREASVQKVVMNDARQIAMAAQQVMLETGVERVEFTIDPETGAITGAISAILPKVTQGVTQVDGVIENDEDTFSLRHVQANGGVEMTFGTDGVQR
jgi:hypothetical protein